MRLYVHVDNTGSRPQIFLGLTRSFAQICENDDQAGWPIGSHLVKVDGLFAEVIVGVAQDQTKAVAEGNVFCSSHRVGKERVCDVGYDHHDHVGLSLCTARPSREG